MRKKCFVRLAPAGPPQARLANAGHGQPPSFYVVLRPGNEHGSPAFERFLAVLGDRVRLKGWSRFKAGLDVSSTLGQGSLAAPVLNRDGAVLRREADARAIIIAG